MTTVTAPYPDFGRELDPKGGPGARDLAHRPRTRLEHHEVMK